MKGELEMEFVDVIDVKQGLAICRVKESFLKKKFSFKNIFFSPSEWKEIGNQFKLEYFTEIHRQKPRFTRPSHDEVSMLLFKYL